MAVGIQPVVILPDLLYVDVVGCDSTGRTSRNYPDTDTPERCGSSPGSLCNICASLQNGFARSHPFGETSCRFGESDVGCTVHTCKIPKHSDFSLQRLVPVNESFCCF